MSLERAVAIARAAGKRAHPKPTVGAVLVRGGETVAEGVTEPGGRHAEAVALAAAGERARGATMYVTLEPCAHHGSNPPCADAIVAAGVERVVVGVADPNPEAAGGADTLRRGGVVVVESRDWAPRVLHEAWRAWVVRRRPFVVFKAAVTLDGRVVVPGRRWVSGEESRRLVHELRAEVDAVAVGGGTAQADRPRLDARGVETPRGQPRRLVFSGGPLPDGLDLELRTGALADELEALADEGVQSLLLEGGPTVAAAFLEADLVDKLLLFVAPVLAGAGPGLTAPLPSARTLSHLTARPVGEDVLLEAYVHEP
ncbi:MAG TPA: bifunctional diaminohydroxyphosphoribosylaminopyrimidine deaminase/5-amino-6-(5-phosphoribosylamino)uracil reductase RibD [Gaiellaceae bacterium]|nr:bifunctional diaminohydroxyphosphoribosylaminopyrimidine deaminase/5-amino-6-(5-phosphoribosylamino)uracil reductase RibD [Gaiellaceae bacterium]